MQEATVQSQEFPLLSRTFPVHILHSCVFSVPHRVFDSRRIRFHLIFLPLGIRW